MGRASPALASFNAGEISPRLAGRTDTDKYAAGCKRLENYIPLIQGPVTRRGGTVFVSEAKYADRRAWLVRFEFSTTDAYVLEFGDGYIRFFTNHGQVLNGASPYEIASPYSAADLVSAEGTFNLRIVQSADVLYICHAAYQTRKLTRFSPTNWVLSLLTTTGGPFGDQNLTSTTVYSSGNTGAVTLTASAPIFTADSVGTSFFLEEATTTSQKPWVSATTGIAVGDIRRHDGKNYVAATAGTTGSDAPVHTIGTVFDGPAVSWTYLDNGYGYAQITGYTSPTQVNAQVIDRIPELATGSGNPTTRWAFGAWSGSAGWPTHVAFFRERLVFGRGFKVWLSVSGDFENFNTKDDSGLVVADSAFNLTLTSKQVNAMLWMEVFSPTSEALMVGTAGAEFAIKSQTESQPFGPDNFSAQPVSTLGSRNVVPERVGNTILFGQRSGRKLQDLSYDYYTGSQGSNDQTLYADHILNSPICQMAYQQEPFCVLWVMRADGKLVAMTYSREQYPNPPHGGWHPHPMTNAVVESICSIPTGTSNELWMVVRRVINGQTKRFVEYMAQAMTYDQDPQDVFFVDSGGTAQDLPAATLTIPPGADVNGATLNFVASAGVFTSADVDRSIYVRYQTTVLNESGTPVVAYATSAALITDVPAANQVTAVVTMPFQGAGTVAAGGWARSVMTVSGLGHLEGQTVDVLAAGAAHPQLVVTGGSITLQQQTSGKVHIGLPMPARLQTMRLNAGAQDGTSQGKIGRIPELTVRLLDTLGLKVGSTFINMDDETFRTTANLMDNAPPLFTGDYDITYDGNWDNNPWMCFEQTDPLPSTIIGIYPQSIVSDKG